MPFLSGFYSFGLAAPRGYLSHNICHNLTISHKSSLQPLRVLEPLQHYNISEPQRLNILGPASTWWPVCSTTPAPQTAPLSSRAASSPSWPPRTCPQVLAHTSPALIGRRDDCEGCYSIYLSTSIYLHSTFYIDRFLLLRLHSQCGSHHLRQQPGRHEHAARAAEHHLALPLRLLPLCQQQVRSLIKFTVTMSHDPAPCCEV